MALQKASRAAHPAEAAARQALATTVAPETVPAAPVTAPAAAPVLREVPARKPAKPRAAADPAPVAVVAVLARPNHRGRRLLNPRWPSEDIEDLRSAVFEHEAAYAAVMRSAHPDESPDRVWTLSQSALVEAAYRYALPRVGEWLLDCPDSRKAPGAPTASDYDKITLSWPQDLADGLRHETHQASKAYPGTLTAAHFILGAWRYAYPQISAWMATIPPDYRRAPATEQDARRLRRSTT